MVEVKLLNVNGNKVQGVRILSPGGEGGPNMLVILCEKGFIMCGYLNMAVSEGVSEASAIISGATFDDILKNPVKALSQKASELGIKEGMSGAQVVEILSK